MGHLVEGGYILGDQLFQTCQLRVDGDCSVETKPEFNLSGDNFWQKPYPNK